MYLRYKVISMNLYKLYRDVKEYINQNKVVIECRRFSANSENIHDPGVEILEKVYDTNAITKYYQEDIKESVERNQIKICYETFSEKLLRLIDEKKKSDVKIYKQANIDRKLFSKIRKNKLYNPSRNTVLCLCYALELSIDESIELLQSAGYTLSHNTDFDLILEYCIVKEIYEIDKINEILYLFNQKTI